MTEAGEAALRRFHEWCRAEGVTYDEQVRPWLPTRAPATNSPATSARN